MTFLLPLFIAASLTGPECHPIDSTSVVARDIAPLVPAFAQLPGDFLFGYVQESGAPRIFHAADLERIARTRGLDPQGLDDLCFARRTFVPQPEQIAGAMRKELGIADAKIEILDSNLHAVPTGNLVFPRGTAQSNGPEVNWRGYVESGDGAKFPVSVRARITATMNRVVAATDLQPRKLIQTGQIRLESGQDSPFDDTTVRNLDEALGFLAKTRIQTGEPLHKSQVERPMDVASGDLVHVDVFEGAAHVILEARAVSAGMKGSIVTVRNLTSGQPFRAQVTGKDQVVVGGQIE
jgi:flagella basal body P-ring formation protein FlgA